MEALYFMRQALLLFTLNPTLRAFLEANDPMALQQVRKALAIGDAEQRYALTFTEEEERALYVNLYRELHASLSPALKSAMAKLGAHVPASQQQRDVPCTCGYTTEPTYTAQGHAPECEIRSGERPSEAQRSLDEEPNESFEPGLACSWCGRADGIHDAPRCKEGK